MDRRHIEKSLLRGLGSLGLALFGTFFAITFATPQWVERFGAGYLAAKAADEVDSMIATARPPAAGGRLGDVAAELYARNEARIEALRADVRQRARRVLEESLAQVRNPVCECRRISVQQPDLARIAQLLQDNRLLSGFIHGAYMKVRNALVLDIRIFAATNAACFLFVLLVSFARPAAIRHLFLPCCLLMLSTGLCAWLYLFSQDWLLTIVQGSYLGYAYAGWLGAVFAFVCDIAFNRGRVTAQVVNGVGSVLGSAFALTPC